MIRNAFFMVCFLLSLASFMPEGMAEPSIERIMRNHETQKKRCEQVAERLPRSRGDVLTTDVIQYRFCYPYMSEYSPFSKELIDEMTRLAYLADTATDPATAQRHFLDYKRFLKVHLGNLDVVKMAYTLAKQDAQFGNSVYYRDVLKILINSLAPSGRPEPTTPGMAYYIMSFSEETYLLEKIGGRIIKSETYEVSNTVYNVHEIDKGDGSITKLYYFDITLPLKIMKDREAINAYVNGASVPKL